MDIFNYVVLILILAGAVVMGASVYFTLQLFELLPSKKFRNSWRNLALLMGFFLLGYLGAAAMVATGHSNLLEIFAGVIFFFGALFVFLVVRTGLATFRSMQEVNQSLEDRVALRTSEIQAKNEELQHFTYLLSHDLKAPLIGIGRLIHFIEEDLKEGKEEEVIPNLTILKGRVGRMQGLIEGIQEYTKIGIVNSPKTNINLNQLVQDIFELVETEGFELKVKQKLPEIIGVKVQFHQLFFNLIHNGIIHNEQKKGWVTVDYNELRSEHEFIIADNGQGISEKFHDKVFVPFQTLKSRDSFESKGIGLSIAKKVIELHKGTIHIASSEDNGTKFIVRLPKDQSY